MHWNELFTDDEKPFSHNSRLTIKYTEVMFTLLSRLIQYTTTAD